MEAPPPPLFMHHRENKADAMPYQPVYIDFPPLQLRHLEGQTWCLAPHLPLLPFYQSCQAIRLIGVFDRPSYEGIGMRMVLARKAPSAMSSLTSFRPKGKRCSAPGVDRNPAVSSMLPSGGNNAVAFPPNVEVLLMNQNFAVMILRRYWTGRRCGGRGVAGNSGMPGSGDGHQKGHCAAIAGAQRSS